MPCKARFIVGPSNDIQVPKFSRLRTCQIANTSRHSGRSACWQACVEILTFMWRGRLAGKTAGSSRSK
jgi:hypothetical protein